MTLTFPAASAEGSGEVYRYSEDVALYSSVWTFKAVNPSSPMPDNVRDYFRGIILKLPANYHYFICCYSDVRYLLFCSPDIVTGVYDTYCKRAMSYDVFVNINSWGHSYTTSDVHITYDSDTLLWSDSFDNAYSITSPSYPLNNRFPDICPERKVILYAQTACFGLAVLFIFDRLVAIWRGIRGRNT